MRMLSTLALACSAALLAQQPSKVLTAADYARAEKFMSYNTAPLVFGTGVRATWITGTDRFWYRVTREKRF